jgi:hypothetical protein
VPNNMVCLITCLNHFNLKVLLNIRPIPIIIPTYHETLTYLSKFICISKRIQYFIIGNPVHVQQLLEVVNVNKQYLFIHVIGSLRTQ